MIIDKTSEHLVICWIIFKINNKSFLWEKCKSAQDMFLDISKNEKTRENDRFLSLYLPLHSGIKGNSYFTWSIFGIKTVNKHPSKAGRKKGRFAKKFANSSER